jgi:L-amino acid N-acyltransferase YncA
MKIRYAKLEDVPAFVAMGKEFHANTRFHIFDFNTERVTRTLMDLIARNGAGKYVFFVADDNAGQPIGGLIGCLETHIFSEKPVANIVHFDVLPERRMSGAALRLLIAFRRWAENRRVFELCAGVNSGENVERLDRFFKKFGFELTGGNYAMRLDYRSGADIIFTDDGEGASGT